MSRRIFKSFDQNQILNLWKILSLRRFYSRDSLLFPICLPGVIKTGVYFLFLFFFGGGGGEESGGSCFVVRDFFTSGCRQNYYLTPLPPPSQLSGLFSSLPTILSLTHSYLKLVRAYDITAQVNDLIDNDQRSSLLFRQCCPRKWVHTATRHSLHTLLHRSIIR